MLYLVQFCINIALDKNISNEIPLLITIGFRMRIFSEIRYDFLNIYSSLKNCANQRRYHSNNVFSWYILVLKRWNIFCSIGTKLVFYSGSMFWLHLVSNLEQMWLSCWSLKHQYICNTPPETTRWISIEIHNHVNFIQDLCL